MRWPLRRTPPTIRPARIDDASALAALHAEGFSRAWEAEEFERLLADPLVVADLAFVGAPGTPCQAFALSRRAAEEAEVLSIVVARRRRRCGIGRALLDAHLTRLRDQGTRDLFLEVDEGNRPALALYDRVRFLEVGRRSAYFAKADGTAATALVLRRRLAP